MVLEDGEVLDLGQYVVLDDLGLAVDNAVNDHRPQRHVDVDLADVHKRGEQNVAACSQRGRLRGAERAEDVRLADAHLHHVLARLVLLELAERRLDRQVHRADIVASARRGRAGVGREHLVVEQHRRLDVVHLAAEREDADAGLGLHALDEHPAVERDEALLLGAGSG